VHTIPIDYDTSFYVQARDVAGGKDERLFEDYFDAQFAMLEALKPPVIGHFDLIRLKSDDPERSFQQWPQVWCKILRNLDYVAGYGGLLELNFASLRKGMSEPYPKLEICRVSKPRHGVALGRVVPNGWQAFLEKGGRFCLSDDSHGVDQVALNYHSALDFLGQAGIEKLHYLEHSDEPLTGSIFPRFPNTDIKSIDLTDLKQHRFWS
jgi:histidinol-phosphatase (PHP family)